MKSRDVHCDLESSIACFFEAVGRVMVCGKHVNSVSFPLQRNSCSEFGCVR
jgi:hypothetical protein